jgi:hypothetical protein
MDAARRSEEVKKGVILDFQNKTLVGLIIENNPSFRFSTSETKIFFEGWASGRKLDGTLDRVTGTMAATSNFINPEDKKPLLSVVYDLQCRPTQRMFSGQ